MGNILTKIKNIIRGIIALKKKGEQKEMTLINCPKCQGVKRGPPIKVECEPEAEMRGIIKCLACGHEFPITMSKNYIQKLDTALPGIQSDLLTPSVSPDIQDDVREAERAHYAQCYKACVTMCRRALQLGLIDIGIPDGKLSVMLKAAHKQEKLNQKTYDLATTIKGFGDIGAHRREKLKPIEIQMVIHATVNMLNELFPQSHATA